jgi:hypothetical protein
MKTEILTTNANLSGTSMSGARLSVLAAVATLIFLTVLHILSPEYDPSFRMVSEYANGKYPWILVLMFECWAISINLRDSVAIKNCQRQNRLNLFVYCRDR